MAALSGTLEIDLFDQSLTLGFYNSIPRSPYTNWFTQQMILCLHAHRLSRRVGIAPVAAWSLNTGDHRDRVLVSHVPGLWIPYEQNLR